jgi:membrane dipeptidase
MSASLDVSEAPVIFSHSSARAIVDHPRDVPDSILARLPKNGGVVMVTFVPSFISPAAYEWDKARSTAAAALQKSATDTASFRAALAEWNTAHPRPQTTVKDVADHIEHVRKVAGVDHVGLGGDFDGTSDLPDGLQDVSGYPNLFVELARRGWSDADLTKLAGANVLRALRQAEVVAARLQKTRPIPSGTIMQLDGVHP